MDWKKEDYEIKRNTTIEREGVQGELFLTWKIERRSSEIPIYVQAIIVLIEIVCHRDNLAEIKSALQRN